jgi:hypothetical protein
VLVRPKQAFVSTANGRDLVLGPADVLDEENIHVRAHPELFERVTPTNYDGVEQATAGPGERRNVHRG